MMAGTVLLWPTTRTLCPPARTAAATALAWLAVSSPACTTIGVSLSPRVRKAAVSRVRRNCVVTIVSRRASASAIASSSARDWPVIAERDVAGRRVRLFGVSHEHDDLRMVGGSNRDERHREREEQEQQSAHDHLQVQLAEHPSRAIGVQVKARSPVSKHRASHEAAVD